jgi:hypothetical protein
MDPFVSYAENEGLWIWPHGLYSQHFIFFLIYKRVQRAKVLYYSKLENLVTDKHSSLLGPFLSYTENTYFSSYEWVQ